MQSFLSHLHYLPHQRTAAVNMRPNLGPERLHLAREAAMLERVLVVERRAAAAGRVCSAALCGRD
jgi:hypothetical protein